MKSIYDYKETIDNNQGTPVPIDFRGEKIEIAAVKRGYMLRFVGEKKGFQKPRKWDDLVCTLDMGSMIMGFEEILINMAIPFMTPEAKREWDDYQIYGDLVKKHHELTYPHRFYTYWGDRDGQQVQVVDHKLDRITKHYEQDCDHCNVSLTSILTVRGGHCYNGDKFLYDFDDFHGQLS